jgi:hypothetical protein
MAFKIMDFQEFNNLVKTYYPLNKEKTRYLIEFFNGDLEFYKYFEKEKTLIKEKWELTPKDFKGLK